LASPSQYFINNKALNRLAQNASIAIEPIIISLGMPNTKTRCSVETNTQAPSKAKETPLTIAAVALKVLGSSITSDGSLIYTY
jgi:hypothetical protein